MKKILCLLLVFAVLLSFAACSNTPDNNTDNAPADTAQTLNPTENDQEAENTTSAPDSEINAENWGVTEMCTARSDTSEVFYINYPEYTGYSEGYGMVAQQLDDTTVIVFGQNRKSPEFNSMSELFPACFGELQSSLEGVYGILSDNFEFSLKDSSSETVGDYQMYKFVGEFEFDNDGEHEKCAFVVYATTLKSNGAYAYWVVYDESEDQSKGQLIAEHALNMAKTFREEQ